MGYAEVMNTPLPIVNLATATFECIFGRGCDGVCCREGEPPVYPEEAAVIESALPRLLPLMRPEARAAVEAAGFLGEAHALGHPKLRVSDGWCAFFNRGCVLHQLGATEGATFRYKPAACALFPLQKNEHDQWYVRQWGHEDEKWDLFCLNPAHSAKPAAESLRPEIELAGKYDGGPA
jgi:hypothetical protein